MFKILPLGIITSTYEFTPGQIYTLFAGDPILGYSGTALMGFNGEGINRVLEGAWIECGYNPAVDSVEEWQDWCPMDRNADGYGPTWYWLGATSPDSGPYFEPSMQWGSGIAGWWLAGFTGTTSNDCGTFADLRFNIGEVYDVPIIDAVYSSGEFGDLLHLRNLPSFEIVDVNLNCSPPPGQSVSWNIEGRYSPDPATATSTPTSTPTGTPAASATPVLVGHVTWQGRPSQPNPLQALVITLTLRLQSGGPATEYTGLATDTGGFFTAPLGTLPGGTYNWRVKGAKYLANGGSFVLTGAAVNNVEVGLMRAGDANDNNVIDSPDFTLLRGSFGTSAGEPGYDDRADFDGNQVVNAPDFSLMKGNFGTTGAPPLGP